MKYAVYFTWNDGFEDTFICKDAEDKNKNICQMIERNEFKKISCCRIYKSGEYGKRQIIIDR